MRPLIIVAVETAMRRGELLALRWADVDLDAGVARLHLTKNGDARDVPLSKRARETLAALRATNASCDDRVFPIGPDGVRLAFERIRKRAGLHDLHFHDLRHEAVSRLFEKGLNVVEVSAISGHKELRMLQRYTHLRAAELVARLG